MAGSTLFVTKVFVYGPRLMHDLDLQDFQAAGVFGNVGHECDGFRALQEQKPVVSGSAGGWGWLQWTGMGKTGRRKKFFDWCTTNRLNPSSDEANYGYLVYETKTYFADMLVALKRTTTYQTAAKLFMDQDERPGVKALASRQKWAKWALDTIQDALAHNPNAGKVVATSGGSTTFKTGSETAATASTTSTQKLVGPFAWIKRLFGHSQLPTTSLPPAAASQDVADKPAGYDPVVAKVQKELSDKGYTGVGMPDGLFGDRTSSAIRTAQHENGLQESGVIDDIFLAALPKIPVRAVSPERASASVQDLRDAGNPIIKQSDTLKMGGGLFGLLGALGGIGSSGILDTAQSTLSTVQDTATTITSVFTTIASFVSSVIGVIGWCTHHWWIFAILGGAFIVYKAVSITEDFVIRFRQAFITRKD